MITPVGHISYVFCGLVITIKHVLLILEDLWLEILVLTQILATIHIFTRIMFFIEIVASCTYINKLCMQ